jgi:AcrR family transcriptional regulator
MDKDEEKRDQPRKHPRSPPTAERVLAAAFGLFCERGFAATSMLDIATRAHVSKRDLYTLFDNKHALLAQCIEERAQGIRRLLDPAIGIPNSKKALRAILVELGTAVLRTVCRPEVLMVYRLAIAESDRAPEIAQTLHRNGREANHRALAEFLAKAQAQGLAGAGDPAALAARFFMVLWDDLLVRLLMRVAEPPAQAEAKARATAAAAAVLEFASF